VLYRRWATRSELALAALRHHGRTRPVSVPDTGSVRDDLIQLLHEVSGARQELVVLFSVQMGEYVAETGMSPASCARHTWRSGGSRGAST